MNHESVSFTGSVVRCLQSIRLNRCVMNEEPQIGTCSSVTFSIGCGIYAYCVMYFLSVAKIFSATL